MPEHPLHTPRVKVGAALLAESLLVLVLLAGGSPTVRLLAGLAMGLLVPGLVASLALFPDDHMADRRIRLIAAVALSMAMTAVVGTYMSVLDMEPTSARVALGLYGLSLPLGIFALFRRTTNLVSTEVTTQRASPTAQSLRSLGLTSLLALVLLLGAGALGVWAVRTADVEAESFTALGVEPKAESVIVTLRSYEDRTSRFRVTVREGGELQEDYLVIVNTGAIRELAQFSLSNTETIDVRVFQLDDATPYRHLQFIPAALRGRNANTD